MNMKKFLTSTKLFNSLLFTISFFILFGCKKLNEKPTDFIGPTNFYNNPDQIVSAYAKAMITVCDGDAWSGYAWPSWGYMQNDDQMRGGNLVISPETGLDLWTRHYAALLNINAAIRALKQDKLGSSASALEKKELEGEGRFLRAWNYFQLVRFWGDIPLLIETTDPKADISRTPVKDVYALIESDLLFAADALPKTQPADKKGRPTSGVAKGMLAKAYLTMATAPLNLTANYDKAASMAKSVMDDNVYSLVPDIRNVISLDTKWGPENMWNFNANLASPNVSQQIWMPGSEDGWSNIVATPEWEQTWPDQPRKAAWLKTKNSAGEDYLVWSDVNAPHVKKWSADPDNLNGYISVANQPILRYADVLLIFAEAENMSKNGPTQAAVDAINQVINRSNDWLPNPNYPTLTTAMSKDAFDKAVIKERNFELCFEQDRYFDLLRKRILGDVNPQYSGNFTNDDYLWPIPINDLRLNKLLTQNPGYPTP